VTACLANVLRQSLQYTITFIVSPAGHYNIAQRLYKSNRKK